MKIFYFTSTGNSLYVARRLGGDLYSVPKILKEGEREFSADSIGLVFPCYFMGTPNIVDKFLDRVTLKSNYIFALITYGNFAAAASNHILQQAENHGIQLSYINKILMVDNYLPLFDMKSQINEKEEKSIEVNLKKIIDDIQSRKSNIKKKNIFLRGITCLAQLYYRFLLRNADTRFEIEDSCDGCGICEKVCPVDNITVRDKPDYGGGCEFCLACAHNCPQRAVRVKGEKSRARFRNDNVDLDEIINAHSVENSTGSDIL